MTRSGGRRPFYSLPARQDLQPFFGPVGQGLVARGALAAPDGTGTLKGLPEGPSPVPFLGGLGTISGSSLVRADEAFRLRIADDMPGED